jgi:hypothetical protein
MTWKYPTTDLEFAPLTRGVQSVSEAFLELWNIDVDPNLRSGLLPSRAQLGGKTMRESGGCLFDRAQTAL